MTPDERKAALHAMLEWRSRRDCPRPANRAPDYLTAQQCIARGECGCVERDIQNACDALIEAEADIKDRDMEIGRLRKLIATLHGMKTP